MTVIIDFDYTLLDTSLFRDGLNQVFIDCGSSPSKTESTYREILDTPGRGYSYIPREHAELLKDELNCSVDEVTERVNFFVNGTGDMLFLGALEFLAKLKGDGAKIVLMTLGSPAWQKQKVEAAQLDKVFDAVDYVEFDKEKAIQKYRDEKNVVVINDNGPETERMKNIVPEFNYIIKQSVKPLPSDKSIPVVQTFDELYDQIKSIHKS